MVKRTKGGRPRLSAAEKVKRGTLRPCRERKAATQRRQRRIRADSTRIPPDYIGSARGYVAGVLAGRIVSGQWLRLVCERQQADVQRAKDPKWPYVWSDTHAIAACEFIERCPHTEGAWDTPTIQLRPWQVFLVTALFGWRLRADPTRRRFNTFYLEVARKAAKSTLAAAIGLFHLLREQEIGASVICGATTGQQARVCFGIMQKMVRRSAWLREQGAEVFANAIVFEAGSARPVNSRASSLDGTNPSCIILDESHAQTFELHDVLKSAQGARRNPLMLCPTTAGYDLLSVGYALRTQLTKVLQGVFSADHLFGAIYALDEGDDWRDENVWSKANPMAGVTPKLDWLRQYCQDAQQAPGLEGEFRVKCCNEWLQSASSWLSVTAWDACADPSLRLENFAGELAAVGADLAQKDDLGAAAITFQRDGLIYVFCRFYLPEGVIEQRARGVPAYREWVNAGLLVPTQGNTLDERTVEADIRQWCEQFNVAAISFDQFGSSGISTRLASDGLPATLTPKNARTFGEPSLDLEVRVRQGLIRHDGNAILRWNVSNCVVSRRIDGSVLPKKENPDSPHKIDGIDALLLAMGGLSRSIVEADTGRSVWEDDSYELVTI